MSRINMNNIKGYSLIELVLYIALISIVLTAIVGYGLNATKIRVKSDIQQEVSNNLRIASEKISYEIRNASSVEYISDTEIRLTTNEDIRNPSVIKIVNNSLYFGYGSMSDCSVLNPCKLTSDWINISSFKFSDVTPNLSPSKVIRFEMTMQTGEGLRSEYRHSVSTSRSVESRSISEEVPE